MVTKVITSYKTERFGQSIFPVKHSECKNEKSEKWCTTHEGNEIMTFAGFPMAELLGKANQIMPTHSLHRQVHTVTVFAYVPIHGRRGVVRQ